jgi:hypothetical protein
MSQALLSAVEELRSSVALLAHAIREDERISEIRKLLSTLNGLEDLCGQERTSLGSILSFEESEDAPARGPLIQPDEFYGLDALVAAKKFLKKRGKAVPFRDIVAAIKAGGGEPGNEDKLKVSLARSTWDIAKIGEDMFGLLEFYPHVKRGKKKTPSGKEPVGEQEETHEGMAVDPHVDDVTPEES